MDPTVGPDAGRFMISHSYVIFVLLASFALVLNAEAFPCNSASFVDSYANLPSVPAFASAAFTGEVGNEIVENHYSERAVMARPDRLTAIDSSQTNCPHMQAGKFLLGAAWQSVVPQCALSCCRTDI